MDSKEKNDRFLFCERNVVFALLMAVSGMLGAYTFTLRGGAFCNAQTANIVIMSIAIGQGRWLDGLYFLIPISAYLLGSYISEILPTPVKSRHFLRWDTWLIGFELLTVFLLGFVPLDVPYQPIQIIVNFVASMQYNTFRQAEGIPMATTFCTNHVRQLGVAAAKVRRKHDSVAAHRGKVHLAMLISFFAGGVLMSFAAQRIEEKAIWIAVPPLLFIFVNLVHADRTTEREFLDQKPRGH